MSERTHSEHCWRWHLECAGALIDRQQAATARVREHCADILKDYSADALTLTVGEVLDLLDGTR